MRHEWRRRLWGRLQNVRAQLEDVGNDVWRVRVTSFGAQAFGMEVSAFLVGDILIDTGFAYARDPMLAALERHRIRLICCTHSHEDHTGNCAAVSAAHGCPVFLRHADTRWDEGIESLAPYRRIWWGEVESFDVREMPDVLESGGRRFAVIPTPGHARTQVAFFESATGDIFTGDLVISTRASAILTWGNPWQEVESLRRVAALGPRRMLTGHGLIEEHPAPLLERKADLIETAARQSVELLSSGRDPRDVVRTVFPKGVAKDRFLEMLTSREFSRLNFVLAAVRHAPGSHGS
jgi:glyoxylase-like metal-dependent hydrolase (beta-lactamase superfamily II)